MGAVCTLMCEDDDYKRKHEKSSQYQARIEKKGTWLRFIPALLLFSTISLPFSTSRPTSEPLPPQRKIWLCLSLQENNYLQHITHHCYQQRSRIHYSPLHTLRGCAVELASAQTADTILADASVTPPSPK